MEFLDNMAVLIFLRNLQAIFRNGYINLHSHRQRTRIPFFPCSPIFVICVLLDDGHLTGVVLTFISLMISDAEHLFMCLLKISVSSFKKYLFRSSAHFLIRLFAFLMLSCMSYLYVLIISPLLNISFENIFSHSEGTFFLVVVVDCQLHCAKAFV